MLERSVLFYCFAVLMFTNVYVCVYYIQKLRRRSASSEMKNEETIESFRSDNVSSTFIK